MKIDFDHKVAQNYDSWYETDFGKYTSSLEEKLMVKLIGEVHNHKVLDIGCGTGNHLKLFEALGSDPVGVDASVFMLQEAKGKGNFKLILAKGEQLPIKDSVFDITTLITTLEFCGDPTKVLQEVGRVTREKIFLGVLNSWSLLAVSRRIKGWFKPSIYNRANFFNIWKLKKMLKHSVTLHSLEWSGVHPLPYSRIKLFHWLDRKLSFRKNPFVTFLGIRVTLKPQSMT
jgi:ubiquinone/menaquinone biosynthesis C-methylase UbiE